MKTLAETTSPYEREANRIVGNIGLGISIKFAGHQCPKWWDRAERECSHRHGDRYTVTLTSGGKSISFDFWNSLKDKVDGIKPSVYDVMACVSADASMPTDADEVYREFGEVVPSQAQAVADHAKRLRSFFTPSELEAISAIA